MQPTGILSPARPRYRYPAQCSPTASVCCIAQKISSRAARKDVERDVVSRQRQSSWRPQRPSEASGRDRTTRPDQAASASARPDRAHAERLRTFFATNHPIADVQTTLKLISPSAHSFLSLTTRPCAQAVNGINVDVGGRRLSGRLYDSSLKKNTT